MNEKLYRTVIDRGFSDEDLDYIRALVRKRMGIREISKELSAWFTDFDVSLWVTAYVIKDYDLDGSGIQLTDIEKDIFYFATDPDRTDIIANKYFEGISKGFVENVYESIGVGF